MHRTIVLGAVITVLCALALVAAHGASARPSRTVVRCDTDDLQAAIYAAPRRATLLVRGTCVGNFTIARDIRLRGVGLATLQGDGGTVVTIAEGADVVLTDVVVTGGSSDVLAPELTRVGGIYNAGVLRIDGDSSVEDNSDFHCGPDDLPEGMCHPRYPGIIPLTGGILNHGHLLLTDRSRVQSNDGRGVFNLGTMNMRRWSSVANNTMPIDGAGVLNHGAATMHDWSSISGNRAMSRAGIGAGVHNTGTFTMNDRSSIHDNEVRQNGGGVSNWGTLTLNDRSSIRNNVSNFTGGGVWVAGVLILNGRSSITENEARGGGGIYVWDEGVVQGSLRGVTGNIPNDCSGCQATSPTPTVVPRTSTPVPTRTAIAPTRTVSPTAVATRAITPTARAGNASPTPTETPDISPTPSVQPNVPNFLTFNFDWTATRDDCGLNLQDLSPPPPHIPAPSPRNITLSKVEGDGSINPGDQVRLYWQGARTTVGAPAPFTYPDFLMVGRVLAWGMPGASKGEVLDLVVEYRIVFSTPTTAAISLKATFNLGPPTSDVCVVEAFDDTGEDSRSQ